MIRYQRTPDGGMDITISLSELEADAIESDAHGLAYDLDAFLYALSVLRTQHTQRGSTTSQPQARAATAADVAGPLSVVERNLLPRVQGVRDALIALHASVGGTLPGLSAAMDVPKATAQSRRKRVLEATPNQWLKWASHPTKNKPE